MSTEREKWEKVAEPVDAVLRKLDKYLDAMRYVSASDYAGVNELDDVVSAMSIFWSRYERTYTATALVDAIEQTVAEDRKERGCTRGQTTTQFCAEAVERQREVDRLTAENERLRGMTSLATPDVLRERMDKMVAERDAQARRIAELERQALLADRSNAERLAAYEKLFRENGGLRKQIEDLTTGQRIKVCSSDDRTETLREESQYPLRSTDKVVPVVNCEDKEHTEWMAGQLCAIEAALGCANDYDPKIGLVDTHSKTLERIRDLIATDGELGDAKERIAELEKALEPFAAFGCAFDDAHTDEDRIARMYSHKQGAIKIITIGHCRHAAEVLGRGRG